MKMEIHEKYMRRCFELAALGLGDTKTNPIVGSVIVHENRIIGEGYHERYGEAHAEVNAIKSVATVDLPLLKEATIYVSLEPCFHFGKTPPCVDLIIKKQIPRVVISVQDPFAEVAGKSIEKLKNHGVEVITGCLEAEGKWLCRRFLTNVLEKRPYIILKYAQSKDGFMGKVNQQIWLTNPFLKRLVHKWRKEENAILVGTQTAKVDNPKLTNRLWFGNPFPIRVVIDKTLKLSDDLALMDGLSRTIVVCEKSPGCVLNSLIEYLEMDFSSKNLTSELIKKLHELKISSIIIEGGAMTLDNFIDAELWDEARVLVGDKWLHSGIAAPVLPVSPSTETQIGSDIVLVYKR